MKYAKVSILFLLVASVPLTVFLVHRQQDLRQRASITSPNKSVPTAAGVGIPNIAPPADYTQDVEVWWKTHPFNPESPNFVPIGQITSPGPIKDVSPGTDLTQAVNSLPPQGGTLRLAPGVYKPFRIIGRSNVHIISESGQAQVRGVNIFNCPMAEDYTQFVGCLVKDGSRCSSPQMQQEAWQCFTNPAKNIYFKNIMFDGGGTEYYAVSLSAVRGVVFDNATFQNYLVPLDHPHPGSLSGSAGVDEVWCRRCKFMGTQRYAAYLDGGRGMGFIDSEFYFWDTINNESKAVGGLLMYNNDDVTVDENQNGIYEQSELRYPQYTIIVNNVFKNGPMRQGIVYHGRDALIKNNTIDVAPTVDSERFLNMGGICAYSNIGKNIVYRSYNNKVIGNRANYLNQEFVLVAANQADEYTCNLEVKFPPELQYRIGKYTVKDNTIGDLNGQPVVRTLGIPDGPNIVENNCVNGKLDGTNQPCSMSTPTPTPIATPTPPSQQIPEDIDRDGCVGILDFNTWFQAIKGILRPNTFPDVNKDGIVDILDFNLWFRAMINLPPEKLC